MIKASYREIDIENFIVDCIKKGQLAQRGIQISASKFYRQLDMPGCGVMDLCCFSVSGSTYDKRKFRCVYISIFELKRGVICCDDVGQLARYKVGLSTNGFGILRSLGLPDNYRIHVDGYLVGAGIDRDAFCLAHEAALDVFTFDVHWDRGLVFERKDVEVDGFGMDIDMRKVESAVSKHSFREVVRSSILSMNKVKEILQSI